VIAEEALDWATVHAGELIHDLNAHTERLLRRVVPQFVETPGMTVGQLRAELEPAFGEARARTIATTEVTRAYSQGTNIIQRQLAAGGLEMERVWRTSMDGRVCEICGEDGLQDQPESEWARIHGPAADGPPAHVNCRCWTTLRSVRK